MGGKIPYQPPVEKGGKRWTPFQGAYIHKQKLGTMSDDDVFALLMEYNRQLSLRGSCYDRIRALLVNSVATACLFWLKDQRVFTVRHLQSTTWSISWRKESIKNVQ
jgi:hypothetical protein